MKKALLPIQIGSSAYILFQSYCNMSLQPYYI